MRDFTERLIIVYGMFGAEDSLSLREFSVNTVYGEMHVTPVGNVFKLESHVWECDFFKFHDLSYILAAVLKED